MKRQITESAALDIGDILDWSSDNFGPLARSRYERLIERGLDFIVAHREPVGTKIIIRKKREFRLYHLRHSRSDPFGTTVASPRHVIVYRIVEPDTVRVVRVLHDAMDLPAHLRDD